MKINDAVFGALLLVLGLAVLLHVQVFPKIPGQNVGPALFPGSIAAALVVCALLLIVSGVRKTQMNQIATVSPVPADQGKRHLHRYFVVVARPPAVEIKSDVALRLAQHPLDQVVLIGEGTRHAGGSSEYLGILPDGVERNHPS